MFEQSVMYCSGFMAFVVHAELHWFSCQPFGLLESVGRPLLDFGGMGKNPMRMSADQARLFLLFGGPILVFPDFKKRSINMDPCISPSVPP